MLIAVLSDIHSNLEALDAVLGRAQADGAETVYVLGDIVGYGADPQAVVERLSALDGVLLAGNHDLAATGRFDTTWFNSAAEAAIRWTEEVIDDEARKILHGLEPRVDADAGILVHGSVVDPAAEYVFHERNAAASFDAESFGLCFFGHTHMPTLFEQAQDGSVRGRVLRDGEPVTLGDGRFMLNPGSVGQPRDGDARASFMIYDTARHTAVVRRVPYDVPTTQRKIRDAGLPAVLAERLAVGR